MTKKFISLMLTIIMLMVMAAVPFGVEAAETNYIVLVLETSDGSGFGDGMGGIAYTAKSPISYTQNAAKEFVDVALNNSNNKIAIVSYKSYDETNIYFTNDRSLLYSTIDSLYAKDKNDINLTDGLQHAHNLLQGVYGNKSVVVLTTGMSYGDGSYTYSGKYDKNVIGSGWHMPDSGVHLYAYANSAHQVADKIKQYASLYTVGIFQTMDGIPDSVRNIASFFRLFTKDLASSSSNYYSLENVNDLSEIFKTVATEIFDPSWALSFSMKNTTKYNPNYADNEGMANKNEQINTGDIFEFAAITSQNVKEISICGDEAGGWYEIPYEFLCDNYELDYWDNNSKGTRIWTCKLGIMDAGNPRTFMLRINGHDTDFIIDAKIDPYNENYKKQQGTPQQEKIGVIVNGKTIDFDVPPQIIEGRTMIPLRAVTEAFGAEVTWNEKSQHIRIKGPVSSNKMDLDIGSKTLSYAQYNADFSQKTSDGRSVMLDSPPVLIDGRTLVPIRAVAEAFWYDVEWDEVNRQVIIK